MRFPKLKLAYANEKKFPGTYEDYLTRLLRWAKNLGVQVGTYGTVRPASKEYPLVSLTIPGKGLLVVTSGFHGEEQAGPITLLERLPEIVEAARKAGVGVKIYPCTNPSGFERAKRYRTGDERSNNYFIEYLTKDGWTGGLNHGEEPRAIRARPGMPEESRLLFAEFQKLPTPDAYLDIHQDGETKTTGVYAYGIRPDPTLHRLLEASRRFLPTVSNEVIEKPDRKDAEPFRSDAKGLVCYEGGGGQDYFHRRGTPLVATLETSMRAPLYRCHAVNLLWVQGFIDAVAGMKKEASVFDECMFGFSDELLKLAKAPTVAQKVDAHFGAEKKNWGAFENDLNSAKFRKLVKGHPEADKKLQQYVQNFGAYLQSKKVVDKVRSRTSGQTYEIRKLPNGRLGCGCKDWQYKHSHKGSDCDHIQMARQGMKKVAFLSTPMIAGLSAGVRAARLPEVARKKQQEGYKIRLRSLGIYHPDLHK